MKNFKNKTFFLFGLGKTAYATAKALQGWGATVWAWDENEEARQAAEKEDLILVDPDGIDWGQVDGLVKAPGVPQDRPALLAAKKEGVSRVSDLDVLYRRSGKNNTFIGITGTNGKSTVTALTAHVLETANMPVVAGGNLGEPALSLPELSGGFYVLEFSSFQCEDISEIRLDGSVILNLTPDHLDRYADMDAYLAAKMRLLGHTKKTAPHLISVDQPVLEKLALDLKKDGRKIVTFSTEKEADIYVNDKNRLMEKDVVIADLSTLVNLPGRHNAQNIAAVWGVVREHVSANAFRQALATYQPLAHRMEEVRKIGNVRFINDSKATNAEAAIPALNAFKNIYWIVGGKEKEEGIKPCLDFLENVKAVFAIGGKTEKIAAQLGPLHLTTASHTLEQAVKDAFEAVQQEDEDAVVLLSPACASFDQFKSFEHRGDVFREAVLALV